MSTQATKKQLEKKSKAELIELLIELGKKREESLKRHNEERDDHLRDIMNLQARVTTMRHQQLREHHELVAVRKVMDGLKTFEVIEAESRLFDIRRTSVMERISGLLRKHPVAPPVPIHVCPVCGKITVAEKGRSGERICEECRLKTDWPWDGEIVWRVNEEGDMEGTCRGQYAHPDGGTISIEQEFKLAE